MNWYLTVLKKYAEFDGRARRMEYWMFTLINALIFWGIAFIGVFIGRAIGASTTIGPDGDVVVATGGGITPVLLLLYCFAMLIPTIAVTVRRLHDIGRSGWWYLIYFIPLGGFVLLVFTIFEGQPGPNQYGPDPKTAA